MKIKITEILEIEKINSLLESYTEATGLVSALLDLDGNILSKSGWKEICVEFHRKNPETAKNCRKSDTELASKLSQGGKFNVYKCMNGLIDVAVPVIINGQHIGNLFTGQFLFESPDENFFLEQARKYNFDKEQYLHALSKVPVIKEEDIKSKLNFLLQMTVVIAEIALSRIQEVEAKKAVKKSEEKYRSLFEKLNEGFALHEIITNSDNVPVDYRYLEINPAFEKMTGLDAKSIIGKTVKEVLPGVENDPADWIGKYGEVALTGKEISFEEYSKELDTWYLVNSYSHQKGQFAVTFTDITERKRAEKEFIKAREELERSEKELKKVQEITHIGSWSLNLESNEVNWSEELYKMYGFDPTLPPPVLTKSMKLFTPESWELLSSSITRLTKTGIPYEIELTLVKKDGSKGWMWARGEALKDEKGRIIGIWGTAQDITDRKKVQKEIIENEKKFRALVEQSITGIYIFAKDRFLYVNNRFAEIFAYTEQEILSSLKPTDVVEREEKARAQENINKRLENKEKSVHYIARGKRKDNKPLWIEIHGSSIELDGEQVITGTVLDITDKYKASEEIKNSENQFRTLFEQAAIGVALIDSNTGAYRSVNQKHCTILGYTQSELLRLDFKQITHSEDLEKDLNFMKQLISGEIDSFTMEKRYFHKNGSIVWVALNVSPLWKKGETPNAHIAVVEDITKRKEIEVELKKYREKLEDLVKERTDELEQTNKKLVKNINALERFNQLFVDREFRIKELKEQIKLLKNN